MYVAILFVHILVCFGLMVSILLQSGKGGSLAGAFGVGGGSQTLFGGRGAATFLTRATQWLGAIFFVTSLTLAFLSHANTTAPGSLIQQEARRNGRQAPAPSPQQQQQPGAPGGAQAPSQAPTQAPSRAPGAPVGGAGGAAAPRTGK